MSIDIEIPGYALIEEIGSGGMARVFAGTQLSLGREVAIKVLRSSLAGGEDFKRRFLHEGQMLAKLNHPNIVPIHDIGQTESAYYMAMEYLRGGTLTRRVKEGLSVAEIIRICTQVAHALNLAHQHKIVHRDLKPSNIMFRDDLTPVLTDFGIARQTDADHRLTKTGMVVGTPYYMSPEQITGQDIDGRADIYSLGVMFYELMSGELPFRAEEPLALAMQHVQQEPPPLPQDLKELQPIMDRMLAKKPHDRFETMLDFCRAIKDLVMSEQAFAEKLSGETKIFNSEQFSDPRFASDALRVPERVTRDVARSTDEGQIASTRASRSSKRKVKATLPPPARSPRRRWLWPSVGGVAALLSVAVGIFYQDVSDWFSGSSGLSQSQRTVVDNLLVRVNAYIERAQIDTPPGENAVEALKQALEIAPGYSSALKLGQQIAVFYETDARLALADGDQEQALAKVASGLQIAPGHAPLIEIREEIGRQVAAAEKRRKIADFLAKANTQMEANQLLEPSGDNALESFQQVLDLDPLNEVASEGRKAIQESLVAQVRANLEADKLDLAQQQIERAEKLFGNSSLVSAVRGELDARSRLVQEQRQVQDLLARADTLFQSGNLVDPPGASAVEDFQAVLRLRPDNAEARQGLEKIAADFERRAGVALNSSDFNLSAELAAAGLRALPDHPALLATQRSATEALGELDREIQQTLQQAERLAQAGAFFAADGQDALNGFRRVLELDPDNSRAQSALQQLPNRVYSATQQMQRNGDFAAAQALLKHALEVYPQDPRFPVLNERLTVALQEQARQQRLSVLLADSAGLIRVTPLSGEAIERAATALQQIIVEYPNDVEVVSQISQFTQLIAAEGERISASGDDNRALALIDSGLLQFADNEQLAAARSQIDAVRVRRREEEIARIAALSGQLAIDATPWGEVVAVSNADGNRSALPADATTPLLLSLVEGDYQVTVQGGSEGQAVRLNIRVQRQQLVRARAQFESMTADRYFERSGW